MNISENLQMERFQRAWQEMTESMEKCVQEGIPPQDVLAAVGVEVPAFMAPLLADMFTGPISPANAPES